MWMCVCVRICVCMKIARIERRFGEERETCVPKLLYFSSIHIKKKHMEKKKVSGKQAKQSQRAHRSTTSSPLYSHFLSFVCELYTRSIHIPHTIRTYIYTHTLRITYYMPGERAIARECTPLWRARGTNVYYISTHRVHMHASLFVPF